MVFVCLFWTQFLCTSANIPTRNVANQARDVVDGGEPQADNSTWSSYGVDVSFPIFHSVSTNYPWLPQNNNNNTMPLQPLGNRHKLYQDHLNACREIYNTGNDDDDNNDDNNHDNNWCDQHEYMRMMMNLRQPASMVNYTKRGFQKIKAPTQLTKLIAKFWKQNHYKGQEEIWPQGNTFVNNWYGSILISLGQKQKKQSCNLVLFCCPFSLTHTHAHSLFVFLNFLAWPSIPIYIYNCFEQFHTHTHTMNPNSTHIHTPSRALHTQTGKLPHI